MKKVSRIVCIVIILLGILVPPVYASEIQPRAITCNVTQHIDVDTKTLYTRWDNKSQYTNRTNVTQVGSVTIQRTKSSSFGISGSVDINKLIVKVNVSAELRYSGSISETRTIHANVPPRTTVYARFGSKVVHGRARKRYVSNECVSTFGSWFNYNYTTYGVFEWY